MVQIDSGIEMKSCDNRSSKCAQGEDTLTSTMRISLREEPKNDLCDKENDRKPKINARKGIATMLVNMALGDEDSSKQQYKKGSIAYIVSRIQYLMRIISLVFSIAIIIFLVTSRINRGKKSISGSFPVGSIGRSVKYDLLLETGNGGEEVGLAEYDEDQVNREEASANSESIDDPDYWADDDDRDLWEDDMDDYFEMDIVKSEEVDEDRENSAKENDSAEQRDTEKEKPSQQITGERNKGLRSKGVKVSLPSSLTLYGRVNEEDSYINGVYDIVMEDGDTKGKRYPKLHHGRAIYMKKEAKSNSHHGDDSMTGELYIYFDGRHEFWVINTSLDLESSKPLAFLPDHALIPIRHVGPYGARPNTSWIFRQNNGNAVVVKDSTVRIVENSSINNPRIPVYITKSTHNWHIKRHKEKETSGNKKDQTKGHVDPYSYE